jgi:hypothetical protein
LRHLIEKVQFERLCEVEKHLKHLLVLTSSLIFTLINACMSWMNVRCFFFVDLAFDLLTSIQPLLSSVVLFAISAVL